jgi:hypothetical protein
MATVNGTPVNFTFGSSAITIANVTGALHQNISYKKASTRQIVKNLAGDRITSAHADQVKTASLEWIVGGSSMAAALTNTILNTPGSTVTISACAALPELVSTDKWEVIDADCTHGNEKFATITLGIEIAAGITTFPAS